MYYVAVAHTHIKQKKKIFFTDVHGLLHDNYDIINLIKKFPVISKCYPISTSTASTYVWLKGQKGGKINGNSKKNQRQLLMFFVFHHIKKK